MASSVNAHGPIWGRWASVTRLAWCSRPYENPAVWFLLKRCTIIGVPWGRLKRSQLLLPIHWAGAHHIMTFPKIPCVHVSTWMGELLVHSTSSMGCSWLLSFLISRHMVDYSLFFCNKEYSCDSLGSWNMSVKLAWIFPEWMTQVTTQPHIFCCSCRVREQTLASLFPCMTDESRASINIQWTTRYEQNCCVHWDVRTIYYHGITGLILTDVYCRDWCLWLLFRNLW